MKKHIKKLTVIILTLVLTATMVPVDSIVNSEQVQAATLSNPRIVQDSSMEAGQKVTYDCVYFGSYPQAEVVPSGEYTALDSLLIQEGDLIVSDSTYQALQNATGWNENGDITLNDAKYRRIKKDDATYVDDDSHYYNWSDSWTYHYFKYEPIKWRVLNVDGNDAFLLADKGLDDQKYNNEYTSVTWETSTIRSWLNGYGSSSNTYEKDFSSKNFIDTAFNNTEQSAIKTTAVINYNSIAYGTDSGNNTNDKIFLLSESEVNTDSAKSYGFISDYIDGKAGYRSDEARRSKSSTYAKAMGIRTTGIVSYKGEIYAGNCNWWLRSPGNSTDIATYVDYEGFVDVYGDDVDSCGYSVRPSLHLDISSSKCYSYAETVCSSNVEWSIDEEGTFYWHKGNVNEYGVSTEEATPWYYQRDKIKNVVIGDGVDYISNYTFMDCENLETITIPAGVTSIGPMAFFGYNKLKSIIVDENNPNYTSVDGVLFNKNKTEIVIYPNAKEGKYVIPNTVTTIGMHSFRESYKLSDLVIPDSVTVICPYAFYDCTSLLNITIPRTVITMEWCGLGLLFYKSGGAKMKGFVMKGYVGTAAEAYAIEEGLTFEDIESGAVFNPDTSVEATTEAITKPDISFETTTADVTKTMIQETTTSTEDKLNENINQKKVVTTKIKKIKKAKKSLKVSWTEVKNVAGYQLQYSTSKKFKKAKKVTIKNAKTTSKTIKKLKENKKYYVRIRTYIVVKGKKKYSGWSKKKSQKTK